MFDSSRGCASRSPSRPVLRRGQPTYGRSYRRLTKAGTAAVKVPVGVDALDADGVLDRALAGQVAINLVQAEQVALAAQWADLHGVLERPERRTPGRERLVRGGGAGTPWLAEFAPAEFGAVLAVSTVSAQLLIADALDLRHRLPLLWSRVQTGEVKIWIARKVATKTRQLSQDAAAVVDQTICPLVSSVPYGRLERILDAAILHADPTQAKTAAEAAAGEQGVWLGRETRHGIRSIFGTGAAPDLCAVDRSLDQLARAMTVLGDTDPHDLRRAKALGLLANPQAALELTRRATETLTSPNIGGPHDGTVPRRGCDLAPATIYAHLTADMLPTPGTDKPSSGVVRVQDIGPVLTDQVRQWLGHRHVTITPVLDISTIRPVDRYEAPPRMAEAIRQISPADYFPYSPNITGRGDNDHPNPYIPMNQGGPPGQTGLHNQAWLGRRNHRIKTFSRWKPRQLHPGAWLWRSPHGHYYLVDHTGTTPLGKL